MPQRRLWNGTTAKTQGTTAIAVGAWVLLFEIFFKLFEAVLLVYQSLPVVVTGGHQTIFDSGLAWLLLA